MATTGVPTKILTAPTGQYSPVITGAFRGAQVIDEKRTPTHGNTTAWSFDSWNDWNASGDNPQDVYKVWGKEGQDRDRNVRFGNLGGIYPYPGAVAGFQFEHIVNSTATHAKFIRAWGMEFDNGNFWSSSFQSRGSTYEWVTRKVEDSTFAAAAANTIPIFFWIQISTRGGAVMRDCYCEIRNFKFIWKSGYYTNHEIVLPVRRSYGNRRNCYKVAE